MAVAKVTSASSLTIRLLHKKRTIDSAIREDSAFREVESGVGRLFVGQSMGVPPTWSGFIVAAAADSTPVQLETKSCGAILFLTVGKARRVCALTFGTGHLALDPDAFERGFGLKVALNAITRKHLRTVDVANLEATVIQRRTQASRDADLAAFSVDKYRDLVRLAAGTPSDRDLARSLSGRDSLTLNRQVTLDEAPSLCARALVLYAAKDYETDFKFIDNVRPVRDKAVIAKLDGLAFAELTALVAGTPSDLHLDMPEIIDPSKPTEIAYYGAGLKSGKKNHFPQVGIDDYVKELQAGRFASLKLEDWKTSHEIMFIKNGEPTKEGRKRVHECIVWETTISGTKYVAFDGEWFAIDDTFYREIEADFKRLLSSTPIVKSTTATNEQQLIAELDKDFPILLNLDKTKTAPTGAPTAQIEFCDFIGKDRRLIHLKDAGGSTSISHLWSQGVVGSESFLRDEGFRRKLIKHVKARQTKTTKSGFVPLLPTPAIRPTTSDFVVAYGLMRQRHKKSGTMDIPFFSKVSLRAAAQRLEDLGFNVEVQLIEML